MESNKQRLKRLREEFDAGCRKRDGYRCVLCGCGNVEMSVHHICDRHKMPNDGYAQSNGILLCDERGADGKSEWSCHFKAEQYHISGGKKFIKGFHPLDLYEQIGSSPEKAWKDSAALGDDSEHDLLMIVDENGTEMYWLKGERISDDKALEVMCG